MVNKNKEIAKIFQEIIRNSTARAPENAWSFIEKGITKKKKLWITYDLYKIAATILLIIGIGTIAILLVEPALFKKENNFEIYQNKQFSANLPEDTVFDKQDEVKIIDDTIYQNKNNLDGEENNSNFELLLQKDQSDVFYAKKEVLSDSDLDQTKGIGHYTKEPLLIKKPLEFLIANGKSLLKFPLYDYDSLNFNNSLIAQIFNDKDNYLIWSKKGVVDKYEKNDSIFYELKILSSLPAGCYTFEIMSELDNQILIKGSFVIFELK